MSKRSDSMADELLDELFPETLDWRRLVRTYPIPALLVSAVGGYVLGRTRGIAVLGALGGVASTMVSANFAELVDDRG